MTEASFASLGPTLLARKGGAKPAMRPQLAPLPKDQVADEALEDLGWNDMGSNDAESDPDGEDTQDNANVVALTPALDTEKPKSPVVKRQQKDLADRVLADAVLEGPESSADNDTDVETVAKSASPIVVKPKKSVKKASKKASKKSDKKAIAAGRRAAFTLRLDADRHLKLRLAATMKGVSAQALVTEALDNMLDQIDDLTALAERMKRN